MPDASVVEWVRNKYEVLGTTLNERSRRLWAAAEARSLGRGGIAAVMAAIGMSSATVDKGLRELEAAELGNAVLPPGHIRRPGGGRKRARDQQAGLIQWLERLVEPTFSSLATVRGPTWKPGWRNSAALDEHTYPIKETVTPEQLQRVRLKPAAFHGEWNYTIDTPRG